ncbi:MAG: hypothetical protein ACUVRH_02010 [Candidatus Bipolaricaulia bacterium]
MSERTQERRKMLFKKVVVLLAVVTLFGVLSGGLLLGQTEAATAQPFVVGPRGPLMELFRSLQAGDLVLLQNGGLVSGTVQQQEFTIGSKIITRDKILLIAWPAGGAAGPGPAQVYLKDGSQVQGVLQTSSITEKLPTGEELSLPITQLRGIIFKIELPATPSPGQEGTPPSQEQLRRAQSTLFPLFSGLQGSALLQAILEGLQKFDLLIFPNGQVLSGSIENKTFTLVSSIFGSHTLAVADLAQIIFDDPDVVVLRIGDRVSGSVTPDGDGRIRATLAATGSAVSLAKTELGGLTFKLPAGPLGGGGRPRFQPGPGR